MTQVEAELLEMIKKLQERVKRPELAAGIVDVPAPAVEEGK